ncbi:class I SAM-dependent methyltransferase [Chitinophaga sp. Cy-1792]|uniref:class I SAM-dependent methyltransferase n=1 Tax=Chitinophaga sp. Cy-1792 TaxID=2608339 RepID=UPI001420D73E|nr:class I SAM-dependent methyltransferase [Chitinophaga sp. Cy-1792]NIG56697.1 class I SAM-dependent methyltransferase [Chitinophaga sp. Cy-1792]
MGSIIPHPAWNKNDVSFDWLYPEPVQQLSKRHWTPMPVALRAARFLASRKDVKILDIGSGVGKFALLAAFHNPEASFYGIEQREDLHEHALSAKAMTGIRNATFIHGNLTQLDLQDFDNFYFYNAFFENLVSTGHIDQSIEYSSSLYHYYCRYLFRELDKKPRGTRLVTYHSMEDEIPPSYQLVDTTVDLLLKMWIKQ